MSTPQHHNPALVTIAVYKLVKATLLILSAIAALQLMNPKVDAAMKAWADGLPEGFSEHLLRRALEQLSGISALRWKQLGFVSLAYAAVFTAEGIGLWYERRWAQYLTIVTSALFLPFELMAVIYRTTWVRVAVLLANAVVVAYLAWIVRRRHRAH